MPKCDQIKEWILFPELMATEVSGEISKHLEGCADCRKFYQNHLEMVKSLQKEGNEHIDHDLLIKFVMTQKEPHAATILDYALQRTQMEYIQNHLRKCPACLAEYESLKVEYAVMEEYIEASDIPDLEFKPLKWYEKLWETVWETVTTLWQLAGETLAQPGGRWITATAIAAAVVLLLLNLPGTPVKSPSWGNDYRIEEKPMIGLVRGAERQDWHELVEKIRQEKYAEAFRAAQAWLRQHPTDPLKTEVAYWGGLSAIYYSSQEFADGNLNAVQPVLKEGIKLLETNIDLFLSDRQKEKALWYLSKAYLMENNREKAKTALEEVVKLRGFYFSRAVEMLDKLN